MKIRLLFIFLSITALTGCCSQKTTAESTPTSPVPTSPKVNAMIPKAVAFRTNGNYSDNVMVRISQNGEIAYYPAPSDISAASTPIALSDGWLLDRQGAAAENTAFLKYTYAEYAALPAVPTLSELKSAIIPGAKVTEVMVLPYPASEAPSKIENIKQYIKNNSQPVLQQTITARPE